MFRRALPVIVILLGISGIAVARNCHQFFAQQVVAVPYVQPNVYYSVGQDLQTEALAERVAALVEKKLALRGAIQQNVQGEDVPAPPVPQNATALAKHCSKCHNTTAAKAGHVFDGLTELKCSQITAAIRAIASNKMPKDHKIDPSVKGQLMEELLNLEILPARKIPDPAPPVPTPGDLE